MKKFWCSCISAYQDAKYGEHYRICNQTTKTSPPVWRCTVCAKEHS